jgi:Family of unknown function (DUF5686)/CarboxypepD_reg-like domain
MLMLLPIMGMLAQTGTLLKGTVTESGTNQSLAFVSVGIQGQAGGTTTDIDGRFKITVAQLPATLLFTYVGHEAKSVEVLVGEEGNFIAVKLKKKDFQLKEVVVKAGPNPAIPIIKKVVANRDKNDPEKLPSYSYTSYNKLIITANTDSLDRLRGDTSKLKTIKFFERNHLFLLESVTDKKFMAPNLSNENIRGIRASGFKDVSFMALATQLQSFTFYKEVIELSDKTYLNPISKNSENKYLFTLEDTLYEGKDSVFVISFMPRTGKNFEALTGVLYINTNGYAIQNVIANPTVPDNLGIKIQQKYELFEGRWFPVQLNTDLLFKNAQMNSANLVGIGRTYLTDIKIAPPLKRSDFVLIDMVVDPRATEKTEDFWKLHRPDSLDKKEQSTYSVIDSLGKANKFDTKLRTFVSLANGRIPIKSIDIEMDKIVRFNQYEGVRLGMGLRTNTRFSQVVNVGGYFAYGFRDRGFKWSADGSVRILKRQDLRIRAQWVSDVIEAGQPEMRGIRPPPYVERVRNAYVTRMDFINRGEVNINFRTPGYLKFLLFGNNTNVQAKYDYAYLANPQDDTVGVNSYTFTEAGVNVRFAFKEKLFDSGKALVSLGTEYPVVYMQYTRGIAGVLNGGYSYNKFDVRAEKTFTIKNLGRPTIMVWAGYIDRPAPYILNYTTRSSYGRNPYLSSMYSFETMRMNEFLSDTYASVFLRHNFQNLLFKGKKFRPAFVLVHNMGWGTMGNSQYHKGINFKTLEKGFFESGLLINDLIKSNGLATLGVGCFYRYGPNALPTWKENIAAKLSLNLLF